MGNGNVVQHKGSLPKLESPCCPLTLVKDEHALDGEVLLCS